VDLPLGLDRVVDVAEERDEVLGPMLTWGCKPNVRQMRPTMV
jgi:hypothetical protein